MDRVLACLRRLAASQDGHATIEFVITFPALIFILLSGIELAMVSLNHSTLERAVDMTVRDIRLGTGTMPEDADVNHENIKNTICDRAAFIPDCRENLRLEMVRMDPRNWTGLSNDVDCTDKSEDSLPVRNFRNGAENELMILRACVKFDPIFPTSGLGKQLAKDGAGQAALIATSAFVQEPE